MNTVAVTGKLKGSKYAVSFVHPTDLVAIFCNALDNAIEAVCSHDESSLREITVRAAVRDNWTVLRFENHSSTPLVEENGILLTTKPDSSIHGFGLKSISYASKHYGEAAFSRLLCAFWRGRLIQQSGGLKPVAQILAGRQVIEGDSHSICGCRAARTYSKKPAPEKELGGWLYRSLSRDAVRKQEFCTFQMSF